MNSDPINPKHYKHLPVEAIDIIEAAISKAPSNESAYLQGQVLKYLLRCWEKEGIEDLRKAKWYLDRMVDSFDDSPAEATEANETPSDPPKRYRAPTQADLRDGQIECEYRDDCDEPWRSGLLVYVLDAEQPFLCLNKERDIANQWEQCQIEVTE